MHTLLQELMRLPELQYIQKELDDGCRSAAITGLSPVHRTQIAAALAQAMGRPLLLLCADERECQRFAGDMESLTGCKPLHLPGREMHLRPAAIASRQWDYQRIAALHQLQVNVPAVVLATAEALCQRCIPPQVLAGAVIDLAPGQRHDVAQLCHRLTDAGYTRCDQVEGPGQFALRGGILDVFSPDAQQPVRCDFFDDEIDALGLFDPGTQRRTENIESALLLPAGEVLPAFGAPDGSEKLEAAAARYEKRESTAALCATLRSDAAALRQGMIPGGSDRYMAAVYPDFACAADYLPENVLVCISESSRASEGLKHWLWQRRQDIVTAEENGWLAGEFAHLQLEQDELVRAISQYPVCQMESLPTSRYLLAPQAMVQVAAKQLSVYGGSLDTAVTDLTHYLTTGYRVLVLCGGRVRADNLQRLLRERRIPATVDYQGSVLPQRGQAVISVGALCAGSEYPGLQLAILTEGQLTAKVSGREPRRRAPKSDPTRQALQSYTDLTPGDLVVHQHHGIGRFVSMIRLPVDGVEKDYIKIAYAGSDCLYVPATQLDLVSKYIGSGEDTSRTKLNKLGGTEWAKTTYRAKAAARDLAKGLIDLYARRQRLAGFAFSPDSPWQQEFEEAFPYTETDDQLRCIREIKNDMEQSRPMDRLLCGDVGYGKTEVALRAVMKCILDGKQAAILVPTTVLAQQHYATAVSRFRSFPVTVEVLSRFRSAKQAKDILERTAQGKVDLLIGTHKLLQKDVAFHDLGLLIIDEEQRFGVAAKEQLRRRAEQVDTLTLSATPIPRTLNMALSGIRDMSAIEEPPRDRQPVQTYVLEHDWGILGDAMRRELDRGGQVYYLHNRVENIESTAGRIRQMLGEDVSIGIAHGKMSESQLSRVMQDMADGEIQVLVCTTIIETGIDIPNVNTLIIEDADRMGLSQLHQIRGRIGRSPRRAYAYLTYRQGKILTEEASKRLTAIKEYVEFGSGFKIAMRDLEIRGAGNLLGAEQSGYMMSVGYDMYLKLLNDAVLEQQGKSAEIRPECAADLAVSAYIPESYVPQAKQRMDLYRRIAAIRTTADSGEILDELLDRFGDPPKAVSALLDVALLRSDAAEVGICDISQKERQLIFRFTDRVDPPSLLAVCAMASYKGRLLLHSGTQPYLTLYLKEKETSLQAASALVERLRIKREEIKGQAPKTEGETT